jgi:DNA-binding NtrC family response regulator
MPAPKAKPRSAKTTVLLVEADVIVRFALADYLRGCELRVIEAVSADDARAILVAGPRIHILLSDAQLAGAGSGFVLAQWVRRHRPDVEVLLTASLEGKAHTAAELLGRVPECAPKFDASALASKVAAMLAERKRRVRQQPKTATARRKRSQA